MLFQEIQNITYFKSWSVLLDIKFILYRGRLFLTKWFEFLPMIRETGVQSQIESYKRIKKTTVDTSLLNNQYYKIWMKGKVEQTTERSSALPYTPML